MLLTRSCRVRLCAVVVLAGTCAAAATAAPASKAHAAACPGDDAGLTLPAGFCATVFADGIGHARHLAVAPDGVVYANTWSGKYFGNAVPHAGGFLVALKDTKGDGKADVIERFGATYQAGGHGGTGIFWYQNAIYAEINDLIVRYPLPPGAIVPQGAPQTVVSGLPLHGDHPMHPFAITTDGSMYVDVGTATNSCQLDNRTRNSPGAKPCTELLTRGGIWRFDAHKTDQAFTPAARYATGIRNAEGIAIDARGNRIFVTQHGRDQLYSNWPKYFEPAQEATLPAEELLLLKAGGDYGWPECYFDPFRGKLVLAPEYGGDGGGKVGVCAHKIAPIAAFPAHWAPDDMVFYDRQASAAHAQFPAHYDNGVFIAFHGSWNRAPYNQQGYWVVYQHLDGDRASGRCEIFADGFAGPVRAPDKALHRPTGLALGPDGALYVADDVTGRIYRIVYRGAAAAGPIHYTPCPSAASPAGPVSKLAFKPPVGAKTAGGAAAPILPVPPGATKEMVALGNRIFHGEVGGAACVGCHGSDGTGSPLGPNLTDSAWLWSDGSYAAIEQTITNGVPHPQKFIGAMPPMGGAALTKDQVAAVAAYVWALSHRGP